MQTVLKSINRSYNCWSNSGFKFRQRCNHFEIFRIIIKIIKFKYIFCEQIGSRQKWNVVFYTTAAFYLFGAFFFEIFATAERQSWAQIPGKDNNNVQPNDIIVNNDENSKSNKYCRNIKIFSIFRQKPKPLNTETPEWIHFKKNNFVF